MRKEVEASIRMIKHSFVEGTFVRLNINTGEEIPLTADMCLEPIIKDLEVLEVLKKNCFMKVWSSEEHNLEAGHYYLVIQESKEEDLEYMSIPITKNDYQKIKEWLENDK